MLPGGAREVPGPLEMGSQVIEAVPVNSNGRLAKR